MTITSVWFNIIAESIAKFWFLNDDSKFFDVEIAPWATNCSFVYRRWWLKIQMPLYQAVICKTNIQFDSGVQCLLTTTSSIPPRSCVSSSTCCVKPNAVTRSVKLIEDVSSGRSRRMFTSPVIISWQLYITSLSRTDENSSKNCAVGDRTWSIQ